jgi:hypothetical protein
VRWPPAFLHPLRWIRSVDNPEASVEGTEMTEVQGRGTGALNVERIYSTTVLPEEFAQALADHFRAQEFEAQVYRTSENRTVMQACKESLWRQLLGFTYALTVVFTPERVS